MKNRYLAPSLAVLSLFGSGSALATNGYFAHGYGVKSLGMAGVGIALPQDGLAAATNPAGEAFLGNRADLGLSWFQPKRGSAIHDNNLGGGYTANGSYEGNDTDAFLLPEAGYVRQLSPRWAVGLAIYGNGGMNTDYGTNPFRAYGANGKAGVNLSQLFVSPSVAYKLNENHAIGLAVNFAYQQFKAKGIQPFASASSSPANFSNQGTDASTGWGVRLGYTGKLSQDLTVGATWSSKTSMGNFDKYKGLFAENGGFDIPANYGVGIAYQATPALILAADVQRIEYSNVRAVGAPLSALFSGNLFGTASGPGFGWKDVTVTKLGASYDLTPAWTIRAGYSHVSQPVPQGQTLLNILAPGVIRDHATLGATWKNGRDGELSFYYAHGFKTTVKGAGSIPANFGGGNADVHLKENILGIGYGWNL